MRGLRLRVEVKVSINPNPDPNPIRTLTLTLTRCEGCEATQAGLCGFVDHPISSWSSGDERWAPDGLHLSPTGYAAVGEGLAGVVVKRLHLGSSRR